MGIDDTVFSIQGYAIAFHVLLPGSGPFAVFTDSFIKVMTMLMGEYDYTINFVAVSCYFKN